MTRKHIQLYRTGSGTTQPAASELYDGEIAVTYTLNHEKLHTKNSSGNVVDFSSDHIIHNRIDEQDERVSNAIGLSATTNPTDSRVEYTYVPEHESISGCQSMNESVEYLATELQNCLKIIDDLKGKSTYNANLHVVANDSCTEETVTYAITKNDTPVTPFKVEVSKSVNDGTPSIILNTEGQQSGTTTSTISGAKEVFTVTAQTTSSSASAFTEQLVRYLCFIGASNQATLTDEIVSGLTRHTTDESKIMEANVQTVHGDYIWICVPTSIKIECVTNDGIKVPMNDGVQVVTTTLGTFECYRNLKALSANTWKLLIKKSEK